MESAKDIAKQMITSIICIKSENYLDIEILCVNFYKGKVVSKPEINLDTVKKCIDNKDFSVKKHTSTNLEIELIGGLKISLAHCCCREWIQVGTMKNIDDIRKAYPSTHYELGSAHYHTWNTIERIRVDGWNRGKRIWMPEMRPHLDNPHTFHLGTSMWTRGTDDEDSKTNQDFFHRYVNSELKSCCGVNEVYDAPIYARKL